MPTTSTTTTELRINLGYEKYTDPTDKATRTITVSDPNTTTAGLSAIRAFNAFMLESVQSADASGLVPATFFQPSSTGTVTSTEDLYMVTSADAEIVKTTKVVTTVD